jgi:hypothetical protein
MQEEHEESSRFQVSKQQREIVVTHYEYQERVIAVTVHGSTIPFKTYFNGEEVYETKGNPKETLQCPLLFKYTSTETGYLDIIHKAAMNHGRKKKISIYEDQYPTPWRTNGKAYINWVVGPKETQQKQKGK